MSLRLASITAEGAAAAFSEKSSTFGHIVSSTSRMCASQPTARSSIQSEDSQTRSVARTTAMLLSKPKPVRIALRSFPPASAPRSAFSS
eukprot:3442368-Pleurochrysis_carterae.AAC.1